MVDLILPKRVVRQNLLVTSTFCFKVLFRMYVVPVCVGPWSPILSQFLACVHGVWLHNAVANNASIDCRTGTDLVN